MSHFFSVFMIQILATVYSKTSNCNYAIDLWWLTANPPSPAPTSSPTKPPTDAPSIPPTYVNETSTTPSEQEIDDSDTNRLNPPKSMSDMTTDILFNPYPIDSCYSFNFYDEPFNTVSIKYECKSGENTLIRNIYWDSLQCEGEVDTTEITQLQQGTFTTFVCNADTNCPVATIDIQSALTTSPTPEPTDSPTTAPPTKTPVELEVTIKSEGEVVDSGEVLNIRDSESSTSNECSGALGPNTDSEMIFEWKYAQNICIELTDLKALEETPSPTRAPSVSTTGNIIIDGEVLDVRESQSGSTVSIVSLGWFCRDNRYAFGAYNNSDCEGDPVEELASYKNDWCAFGNSAWAYVGCVPTPAPSNAPTTTPCADDNDCTVDELCVTGEGHCRSKIVDEDCGAESDCDDGYKCNTEHGFCYFSECEGVNDCDVYEEETGLPHKCETSDGAIGEGDSYSYGVCAVMPVHDRACSLGCFTAVTLIMSAIFVIQ